MCIVCTKNSRNVFSTTFAGRRWTLLLALMLNRLQVGEVSKIFLATCRTGILEFFALFYFSHFKQRCADSINFECALVNQMIDG